MAAWLYVAVSFGLFLGCFVVGLIYTDSQQRAVTHVRLPRHEVALRGALRWTFCLAAFMICLSLPLTSVEFFASSVAFGAASTFVRIDMVCIKNIIHGGFMVGSYSNFVESGNARYHTISQTLLSFMLVPCTVGVVLSAVQCYLFGFQYTPVDGADTEVPSRVPPTTMAADMAGGSMANGHDAVDMAAADPGDVWANLAVSAVMLCLVACCLVVQRRAFGLVWRTKFHDRADLMAAGARHAEQQMADRWPQFERLRASARRWVLGEGVCFVAVYALILVNRLPVVSAAPIPFSAYVQAFIPGYTMSIHLGWTVGNGLFGLRSNSVKCLDLYGLSKLVIGGLTLVQTGALGVHTFGWVEANPLPVLIPSWVVSLLYVLVQAVIIYKLQRVRTALHAIDFNTDRYIPAGSAVAASFGFSVWDLAGLPHLSAAAKARAKRAAVCAILSFLTFQLESVSLVWMDDGTSNRNASGGSGSGSGSGGGGNVEWLINALDYGIHSIAIFMLSYYRSVQNYPVRLQRRKTIQMFIMLLYAVLGAVQFGSVLGAVVGVDGTGWTSRHVFVALLTGSRALIHGVASHAFYHLRIDEEERDPSVICSICCIAWKRTLPTELAAARQRRRELEARNAAELAEEQRQALEEYEDYDSPPRPPGLFMALPPDGDGPAGMEMTALRSSSNGHDHSSSGDGSSPPVARLATAAEVMNATAFYNFDHRLRRPQRIVVKPHVYDATGNGTGHDGNGTSTAAPLMALPVPAANGHHHGHGGPAAAVLPVAAPVNTSTTDFLALVRAQYRARDAAAAAAVAAAAATGATTSAAAAVTPVTTTAGAAADDGPGDENAALLSRDDRSSTGSLRATGAPNAQSAAVNTAATLTVASGGVVADVPVSPDFYLNSLYPAELTALPVAAVDSDAAVGGMDHSTIHVPAHDAVEAGTGMGSVDAKGGDATTLKLAAGGIAATTATSAAAAEAAAAPAPLSAAEQAPFDWSERAHRQLLYAMSLCALYLGVVHSFAHDPTGAVQRPGEHASFSSGSVSVHDLSLGTWHTPGYSIAFHYCFLVFGYGYRGLRARNVMFMEFTALCCWSLAAAVGLAVVQYSRAALAFLDATSSDSNMAWSVVRAWTFPAVLAYMLMSSVVSGVLLRRNARWVTTQADRFPQVGHSMV